jgi:hypothetical protein
MAGSAFAPIPHQTRWLGYPKHPNRPARRRRWLPAARTLENFRGAFKKLIFPDRDLVDVNVQLLRQLQVAVFPGARQEQVCDRP